MRTITLSSGRTVEIPTTGNEWQLYTSSMACSGAAKALTSALVRALRKLDWAKSAGPMAPVAVYDIYREIVWPVMVKYRDYGATDTEPRGVAQDALGRVYGQAINF